jgi:hypothetical protein
MRARFYRKSDRTDPGEGQRGTGDRSSGVVEADV